MPRHYEDFTGQIINGAKIIGIDPNSGGAGKHRKWFVECPLCLNIFTVQSNHLKEKKTGLCPECVSTQREDLTGQTFYELTVDYMIYPGKYQRTLCSCTCSCGNTNVIVRASNLKRGATKSCGCKKNSFGEEYIAQLLEEHGVDFEVQKTFPNLKYKNNLYCDFYIPSLNLVIEYNGAQHYKPVKLYGGEENLKITQARDDAKQKYCEEHNINYLVIKYNEDIKEILSKNNII